MPPGREEHEFEVVQVIEVQNIQIDTHTASKTISLLAVNVSIHTHTYVTYIHSAQCFASHLLPSLSVPPVPPNKWPSISL